MAEAERKDGRRATTLWLGAGVTIGAALAAGVVFIPRILGSADPPAAAPAPEFVEEAAAAGLDHVYDGEFIFFVGGGVAAFDCDGDGFSDLYFAGGANPAGLYRNRSDVGGALRFERLANSVTDMADVVGAYPLDLDADDHVDLAVLRVGENVMLRGTGDCRFERANERWSIDGGDEWTAGFSATWEDESALPTLAFGNYLDLDADRRPTWSCEDNVLFRPDGRAGYGASVPLSPGWCTLSILFSDWNRTGRHDLRMANDRHYYREGEEQLWRIEPDAPPTLYSSADGWKTMQIWGMGIASQDVTGDGVPEVFLTSQGDNKLQTLDDGAAGPAYGDIAIRRGVTAHRPHVGDAVLPSTAWHPEFQDVNNDGFIDLYISKGNVEAMTEYAAIDPNNLLLGQPDGSFVEGSVDAGIVHDGRTRGAAVVDLNLDGLLDLVEVNRRQPVTLWRNTGDGSRTMGSWVALYLEQEGPNRNGVGAWISVHTASGTVERQLTVGGGHAGGQLGWLHFGLGADDDAEVVVEWPDGTVGEPLEVVAGSFVVIRKGADGAEIWQP